MKGFAKAIKRTPFNVSSKIGLAKRSNDPEFDDYQRQFTAVEQGTDKLIKDSKAFTEAVTALFTAGAGFGTHFATIFQPIAGEFDLIGKHPDSEKTIKCVMQFQATMEELRSLIGPELELIQSRIAGPAKELQGIVKMIRKSITKRDHKLTDYDRHNKSLTKLRDKKEKSLSDEKNLFKLEQDFEIATNEYDYINNALKQDLPRFMQLAAHFIDPLFNSLYYMQLNIYYLILEKMNAFAEDSKYDITNTPGAQIASDYESNRSDAWNEIENLNITKRLISVSKAVQVARTQNNLNRANTTASASRASSNSLSPPPSRTYSSASFKKSPPPPPSSSSIAPPPYTPSADKEDAAPAPTKRAPPPPPLKSKPKTAVKYVVALYDFSAQAEGDLSFNAGDRIELVERTANTEDWWTGRLNGKQGVFPGK
jgi:amphiphysin